MPVCIVFIESLGIASILSFTFRSDAMLRDDYVPRLRVIYGHRGFFEISTPPHDKTKGTMFNPRYKTSTSSYIHIIMSFPNDI